MHVPSQAPRRWYAPPQGWRATKFELPNLPAKQRPTITAPGQNKLSKNRSTTPVRVIVIDLGTTHSGVRLRRYPSGLPTPRAPPTPAATDSAAHQPAGGALKTCYPPSLSPGAPTFRRQPRSPLPPWDESRDLRWSPGPKARCETAGRLWSSAKSWLSHSGVYRTSPPASLPRTGRRDDLSRRGLAALPARLRQAWDSKMPDASLPGTTVLGTLCAGLCGRSTHSVARIDPRRDGRQAMQAIRTLPPADDPKPPLSCLIAIRTGARAGHRR